MILCCLFFLSVAYENFQYSGSDHQKENEFAVNQEEKKVIFAGMPGPEGKGSHSVAENETTEIPAPDSRDQVYESNIDMYIPVLLIIGVILIFYYSKTSISSKS